MTKSYLPHLTSVFLLHVLVLLGTWQLSQTDFVKAQLKSVGHGVMKLKLASQVMQTPVVRKTRPVPVNPLKPKEEAATKTVPAEPVVAPATGSEFGTSAQGKSDILSLYKSELRAMIDRNKEYPAMSRRLGQQGTVVVAFTLLEDGHIIDVKVDKPSPYERLNESAVAAVRKVDRFKPIPRELGELKMVFKIPVKFITI